MGSIIAKNTEVLEDGHYILVKYRHKRSRPYYVALVVIDSKKFKKNFKTKDAAGKWLEKVKEYKTKDFEFFGGTY